MKLEPHGVGRERPARQPRPFDRALAFFDPLLARAALVVERDHALGRLCRHHDVEVGAKCDHRPPLIAQHRRKHRCVRACLDPDARPHSPISIPPGLLAGGDVISVSLASAAGGQRPGSQTAPEPASPLIRTGTKLRALTPTAVETWRRHTVSRPRATPCRRATSEMFAPSSKLPATIRAFSSAPSAPPPTGDHLDTAIRIALVPGIKHGI